MHRLFTRPAALRAAFVVTGGSALTYQASNTRRARAPIDPLQQTTELTPAEQQFNTSSLFPIPPNCELKPWKIRNNYPKRPPSDACSEANAPWLYVDFRKSPEAYASAVRSYFLEGLVQSDFDADECKVCICDV